MEAVTVGIALRQLPRLLRLDAARSRVDIPEHEKNRFLAAALGRQREAEVDLGWHLGTWGGGQGE